MLKSPVLRAAVAACVIVFLVFFGIFCYYYVKYQKIVDKRFYGPIFANTAKIYAQPREVRVGQKANPEEIANYLRHTGYTEAGERGESKLGTYRVLKDSVEIKPGSESYYNAEGAVVRVADGKVDRIASLARDGGDLSAYDMEPQLVTGLFDTQQRTKRRIVKYDDIPKVMVNAVVSIEDRQFFHHSGVNFGRLVEAALIDLKEGGDKQGASTLTMQVARGFFLSPEKKFKRKLIEILISFELEQRFSKKQIFELYANEVDMGQRGSFTITGFGEAANAYFGKDLKDVTLPEAALLAGLVQRPSYLSPYRHPQRAVDRRNLVLQAMVDTGSITQAQADVAKATPLKLAPQNVEASDAPYFVDLIRDQLVSKYGEDELNHEGYRVYTTIDPPLQKAAADAVSVGIKEADAALKRLRTRRVRVGKKYETKVLPGPEAQVALVALDPHTGEVLALVGGRNYGWSQLNHAVAKRPTGSIFKPFVYATAVNNALTNEQPVFTPATLVDDSPTAFINGDDVYTPRNFEEKYYGQVTAQKALDLSLNNATVKVAEMVGYDKVAALAKAAGIMSVQATPAMALGSYDATPMEMASAYTVFANAGTRITPLMVKSVRDPNGDVLDNYEPQKTTVLDPRVAFVITKMLEGVVNNGTAVGVRARGFTAPAAGKTGSSHDAWFAGYTSNLLCVVWVGFDDYSDVKLTGAALALPIWTEFMKHAVALPEYSDVAPFTPPPGVVQITLDKSTNEIATPACPDDYTTAFIDGTQPTQTCEQTATGQTSHGNFFQRMLGMEPKPAPPASNNNGNTGQAQTQAPAQNTGAPPQTQQPDKKKGFWGRLFGGGNDKKDDNKQNQPAAPGPGNRPPL